MTSKPKAAISWSGGKDSCAALQHCRADFDFVAAITMFDEDGVRSRSHGLRRSVVDAQVARLRLAPIAGRATWPAYTDAFGGALEEAKALGVTHVVFGDIMFDEHRRWAESVCASRGLTAVEPLFGRSTTDLFVAWTASGAEAVIVTTRAALLGDEWLGRVLSRYMLDDFARLDIDPCGERGEYHTVVTDSALFSSRLTLEIGPSVRRADCWALDVTAAGAS